MENINLGKSRARIGRNLFRLSPIVITFDKIYVIPISDKNLFFYFCTATRRSINRETNVANLSSSFLSYSFRLYSDRYRHHDAFAPITRYHCFRMLSIFPDGSAL